MLEEVARRRVYGSVLPFALSREDQRRSGFEYSWRIHQLEYSRNILFHSGRVMEEVHNGLIDRNRDRLDVKEVKTIFGVRGRPHQRLRSANEPRGRRDTAFKTVRDLEHNLRVFKLQWARSTLKIYAKGARLLRIEAVEHNVKKTKCRGRYKLREASCDLRKPRGKGVIERIPKTRRYRIHPRKIGELATLLAIREKVVKPLHAKAGFGMKKRIKSLTPIDRNMKE